MYTTYKISSYTRFPHPLRGVNTPPNFRTTPPASYLDNPPNISQGVLNIIITFAKYEQYLVYIMFIVDSDGGYLFIEFCIKIENSAWNSVIWFSGKSLNCCHQMSDFKAKNAPNSILAGAPTQTPLGELTALSQTP